MKLERLYKSAENLDIDLIQKELISLIPTYAPREFSEKAVGSATNTYNDFRIKGEA